MKIDLTVEFTVDDVRKALELHVASCNLQKEKVFFDMLELAHVNEREAKEHPKAHMMRMHLDRLLFEVDRVHKKRSPFRTDEPADCWYLFKGWVSDLVGWDCTINMKRPNEAYSEVCDYICRRERWESIGA